MKRKGTMMLAMMLALLLCLTACDGTAVVLQDTVESLPDNAETVTVPAAEAENTPSIQLGSAPEAPIEAPADQIEPQAAPAPEAPAESAAQTASAANGSSANGTSAAQGTQSGLSQPIISVVPQQNTQTSGTTSSGSGDEQMKKGDVYEAVRLINLEREKMGLKDLEINDTLMEAAAIRAEEQVEDFGHTRPDGSAYYTIFDEVGYDGGYGVENAGMGTNARRYAYEQVDGWMNSPGHKANILSDKEDEIGVGYYSVGASSYWIMLTGRVTGTRTSSGSGTAGNSSSGSGTTANGDVYEAIRLINQERVKAGLDELEIDSGLMEATALRAREIAELYDHVRPDGSKFYTVIEGGYWSCAENIYRSPQTAQAAVEGWMNSSGHKANILREGVESIGVGYYHDGSMPNWVMIVARLREEPGETGSSGSTGSKAEPEDAPPVVKEEGSEDETGSSEAEEAETEEEPEPIQGGDVEEWLRLVNAQRAKNGKEPMTVIAELMELAEEQAEELLHATSTEIYGADIAGRGIELVGPYDHRDRDRAQFTGGGISFERVFPTAQAIVDYHLRYDAASPLFTKDEMYIGVGYYQKDGAFLWIMVEVWFETP